MTDKFNTFQKVKIAQFLKSPPISSSLIQNIILLSASLLLKIIIPLIASPIIVVVCKSVFFLCPFAEDYSAHC